MSTLDIIRSHQAAGEELGSGSAEEHITGSKASPPLGVEALIEYRGLALNIREWIDTYLVTNIDGVDDADVRTSSEVKPGRHGGISGNSLYGERTIVLTVKITTKTIWKLRDMETALKRAFKLTNIEYPLYFRSNNVENDVFILCKKSQKLTKSGEVQETASGFTRTWQVTLKASNPRFLSYIRQYQPTDLAPLVNQITNPRAANNITDGTGFENHVSAGATIVASTQRSTVWGKSSATSAYAHFTNPDETDRAAGIRTGAGSKRFPVTSGSNFFAAMEVNLAQYSSATRPSLIVFFYDAGGIQLPAVWGPTVTANGESRVTSAGVVPDGAVSAYLVLRGSLNVTGDVVEMYVTDAMYVEGTQGPVPFFIPGVTADTRWSGTAEASTSVHEPTKYQTILNKSTMDAEPVYELSGPLTDFVAKDPDNPFDAFRINGTIPDGVTYVYDASVGSLVDKTTGDDKTMLVADDSGDGLIFEDTVGFDYSASNRGANSGVSLYWRHSYA